MAPKKIDKEAKKREIIAGAIQVYAELGYQNTSMEAIADALNIGRSTLYHYFNSREALFTAAFDNFMDDYEEAFAELQTTNASVLDVIGEMIAMTIQMGIQDETMGRVMLDFWAEAMRDDDPHDDLIVNFGPMYQKYRDLLGTFLEQGKHSGEVRNNLDITATSNGIIALMEGIMIQWMVDKDGINPMANVPGLVDFVIAGIKA